MERERTKSPARFALGLLEVRGKRIVKVLTRFERDRVFVAGTEHPRKKCSLLPVSGELVLPTDHGPGGVVHLNEKEMRKAQAAWPES